MEGKGKGEKNVAVNRRASHDYFLEDRYECGMALTGTEIKSVRAGKVQFKDAYISIYKGEAWIKGMHISPYKYGNIFNVDETRDRKLLRHKYEISKLYQKVKTKGYTLVPVRMYLKNGKAKAVRFSTLDEICKALSCQPGDILVYEEGAQQNGD